MENKLANFKIAINFSLFHQTQNLVRCKVMKLCTFHTSLRGIYFRYYQDTRRKYKMQKGLEYPQNESSAISK